MRAHFLEFWAEHFLFLRSFLLSHALRCSFGSICCEYKRSMPQEAQQKSVLCLSTSFRPIHLQLYSAHKNREPAAKQTTQKINGSCSLLVADRSNKYIRIFQFSLSLNLLRRQKKRFNSIHPFACCQILMQKDNKKVGG